MNLALKLFFDSTLLFIVHFYLNIPKSELIFLALYCFSLFFLGIYKGFSVFFDQIVTVKLLIASLLVFFLHHSYSKVSLNTLILLYSLSFIFLMSFRLMLYLFHNKEKLIETFSPSTNDATIILGAGEATKIFLEQRISNAHNIIGLFDNNPKKIGRSVRGISIVGGDDAILPFLKKNNVKKILYMIPSVSMDKYKNLFALIQAKYPDIIFLVSPSLNDINS